METPLTQVEPVEASETLRFGAFTLWPDARLLQDGLGPVHIGSRALDLLIVLIRNAGNVVDKQQLMRSVWSDVSVAEGSLGTRVDGPTRRGLWPCSGSCAAALACVLQSAAVRGEGRRASPRGISCND